MKRPRRRLGLGHAQSPAVEELVLQLYALFRLPVTRELRFHPVRKWRFDLALVDKRVGIEVDGGSFVQGGHSRGPHQRSDIEKAGEAMKAGWIVVRCMPEHVRSGQAIEWVLAAVRLREGK